MLDYINVIIEKHYIYKTNKILNCMQEMHIKNSSSCSIGGRKKNRRKSEKSSLSCCERASYTVLPTHSCSPNTACTFMEGVQHRPVRTSIFMMCLDPEWAKMNSQLLYVLLDSLHLVALFSTELWSRHRKQLVLEQILKFL